MWCVIRWIKFIFFLWIFLELFIVRLRFVRFFEVFWRNIMFEISRFFWVVIFGVFLDYLVVVIIIFFFFMIDFWNNIWWGMCIRIMVKFFWFVFIKFFFSYCIVIRVFFGVLFLFWIVRRFFFFLFFLNSCCKICWKNFDFGYKVWWNLSDRFRFLLFNFLFIF